MGWLFFQAVMMVASADLWLASPTEAMTLCNCLA